MLLEAMKNKTFTENGAVTYKSTLNKCLDLFALGGAYRNRTDYEVIALFKDAYEQDPVLAMQILFYLRDIRGGQGERRFFRVCINWLANQDKFPVGLVSLVEEYGRYDDLMALMTTKMKPVVIRYIRSQLAEDLNAEYPTLLAKWLPSENASSKKTKMLAREVRKGLEVSPKRYRQILSLLRGKIGIVETKMTNGEWSEIDYAKLPSKAGFQYRRAFLRNDEERYTEFMQPKDGSTVKVNAGTMYPYEIVSKALDCWSSVDRSSLNAYWGNLPNYISEDAPNAIAVVDVSGSMCGTPMEVAISLGLYTAERNKGKFHNHFITFSSRPQLIEIDSTKDFVGKVHAMESADWGMSTDVKASFDLILDTAKRYNLPQSELPEIMYVISDMEFDSCGRGNNDATFEIIKRNFRNAGYTMPHLVFWNVDARNNNIPMVDKGNYSLVSGFSPVIFEMVAKRMTATELMINTVTSPRYQAIADMM